MPRKNQREFSVISKQHLESFDTTAAGVLSVQLANPLFTEASSSRECFIPDEKECFAIFKNGKSERTCGRLGNFDYF